DRSWVNNRDTIGCQYDWFNPKRDRKIFHWPSAVGQPDTSRDVDWDMSTVFDPSHPRAAVTVAVAGDRDHPEALHIFPVRINRIDHLERAPAGRFGPSQCLATGLADMGPTPPAELDGFDSAS